MPNNSPNEQENSHAPTQACVILLHGLARSYKSMRRLEKTLTKSGYTVVNKGYDSRHDTVENLAEQAFTTALPMCENAITVHIVTHSMGGILTRYYLSQHSINNLGRVVMLAPPNHGSEVVDSLGRMPGFRKLNGPAGDQLGTDSDLLANLAPIDYDLGIIAGTKTINLILSQILPKPNDGKVSVESTKVAGMNAHLTLSVSHPFIMKNKKVIKHVQHYLKTGTF